MSLRPSLGSAGAPGSVPGGNSPPSRWLRMAQGSTANSTTDQIRKKMAMAVVTGMSTLFQLDQRAGKILRMQEQDGLAMGADLRLAVAEDPRAGLLQRIAGGADVVNP